MRIQASIIILRRVFVTPRFCNPNNIRGRNIILDTRERRYYSNSRRRKNERNFAKESIRTSSNTTTGPSNTQTKTVKGEVLDLAIDLRSVRPGDQINVPYELTVSECMSDFWQSAFHSQDRISTSTPFARKIGLQDRALPFSLVLFLTSSMTHADAAKVQVGFDNAIYHWPAFAGDTFTKRFRVKSVRNTSDGNHTVIHFKCELINQRGRVCMSTNKTMMFEFSVATSCTTTNDAEEDDDDAKKSQSQQQLFRDHIVSKAETLIDLGSQSLAPLTPGQLILHTMNRSMTLAQSQQLASLARITHEKHFDTRKYDAKTEILVPGGLVLGLALSASSRDLHEVLHEEIVKASFVNNLPPDNVVGAITYVKRLESVPGDLESLLVKTIGVKNLDVKRDLEGMELPLHLFAGGDGSREEAIMPKDIERICKKHCPVLSKKIVVMAERRIIRQATHKEVFLL